MVMQFQFTHPGRGATVGNVGKAIKLLFVSIHAPREGCDIDLKPLKAHLTEFQFTHPGRGATGAQRYPRR